MNGVYSVQILYSTLFVLRSIRNLLSIISRSTSRSFTASYDVVSDERVPTSIEALGEILGAAIKCRFEATDIQRDELVLMKILQIILTCLRTPVRRQVILVGDLNLYFA